MSGFNLSELLPFYLDETDDQIGQLNEALLQLEREPSDATALQQTFRIVHTIKGSSSLMGFEQVSRLTHALESYFDQLRKGSRTLDRPALNACFRCLDNLRDYHHELRSAGQSGIDLSESIALVRQCLETSSAPDTPGAVSPPATQTASAPVVAPPAEPDSPSAEPLEEPSPEPAATSAEPGPSAEPAAGSLPDLLKAQDWVGLTIVFEPGLQWRDMKARLVLNRLASKARVLSTEPPVESLEEEPPPEFTVWLAADRDVEELRGLADVDGVAEIRVFGGTSPAASRPQPKPTATAETPETVPGPTPQVAAGAAAPPGSSRPRVAETLRVEVDRLDHLMNLAGELVINKARCTQIAGTLTNLFRENDAAMLAADAQDRLEGILHGFKTMGTNGTVGAGVLSRWEGQLRRLRDNLKAVRGQFERLAQAQVQLASLAEAIDQLNRVAQGIQKGVLDTRMVPIKPLFERFRRVIRDLTVASGKEVELKLSGEATELDKRMIDELADPLIHMVRNSVDHGLELPDDRVAAGKPRAGVVALQASHRGNSVVITVSDDGRGIDAERIRHKVVEHGLLRAEEAAGLDPRRLIPYIFHPGLSTADRITEISGRGVGMDIVKSRIEAINGRVDVRSEPGRGTTFTIRLPLTLAILPSLLVRILDESYALPLDAIEETLEVSPDHIFSIHGRRTIDNRGRILSLIALNDVFRWGGTDHPLLRPGASRREETPKPQVVLVHNGETTIGLEVDQLIGIQEVVLKSLERHFRPIFGLSGASILGDGRVCLILDIDAVIGMLDPGAARQRALSGRANVAPGR